MIARVSLEIALRREFDYAIPPELADKVNVGSRVQVPFGARKVLGVVTGMAEESAFGKLKPVIKIIGAQTLVTPKVLKLARWIADYYCCAPEVALKSVLPEAVRKEDAGWRERLFVRILPQDAARIRPADPAGAHGMLKLPKRQLEVWNIIEERREMLLSELVELAETTAATVRKLEDRGLVSISREISERDPYSAEHILPTQPLRLNPAQFTALRKIMSAMNRGEDGRLQVENQKKPPSSIPRPSSSTFLLHGVTGSGKTEIYLQAIAHALEQGKGAIVLVPEISLTPQTVERFKARFSSGKLQTLVAVLHSHLSAGERHDEWHKIRQRRARIVIGARSAIFAPVEPLGLIIVDEEHEHTYKQEEAPRYHARDVAVMRGRMENAVVLLGSATPSLESYYNCKRDRFALLELPERVDDQKMPLVRVVDMRQSARSGKGPPIFSPQLREAILRRLEREEQTILFLNRRGYSTSLVCEKCGHVCECPNCSVALTYHRDQRALVVSREEQTFTARDEKPVPPAGCLRPVAIPPRLLCHVCGYQEQVPRICPNPSCKNPAIRYSGLGTQKVEDVLGKLFPRARIRRMDADVMKRKEDYRRVLGEFRHGKIDILIGTQMIAKGLHFPGVTLVGIIYADLALHQPDFRAGERTFQLLTQVAGRAGRGDIEGEVFVQAFTPFHPAIQYARRHDFNGFFEQELEFRRQLNYPPFSRIALLTLKGHNEDKVKFSADHLRREIEKLRPPDGASVSASRSESLDFGESEALSRQENRITDLQISGPTPAPLMRAENLYRYHIMLRTRAMSRLSRNLAELAAGFSLPDGVALAVDVDPVNLA